MNRKTASKANCAHQAGTYGERMRACIENAIAKTKFTQRTYIALNAVFDYGLVNFMGSILRRLAICTINDLPEPYDMVLAPTYRANAPRPRRLLLVFFL